MQQETQASEWKEHIRKRPGMYIGSLNLIEFQQMLEYLFEELLKDSFLNPIIEIEFYPDCRIAIKIRNINTKKIISRLNELETTGNFQKNLGLAVFIKLSADISIAVNDIPSLVVLYGQKGNYEIAATTSPEKEKSVFIHYVFDNEIFKDFEIIYEHINLFFKQFAFLNPGLKIISVDRSSDELQRNVYYYQTGIFKQLDYYIAQQPYGKPLMRVDKETKIKGYSYQIGLCYSSIWLDKTFIKTYAGNIETYLGGSLNDGILEGLIQAIKTLAQEKDAEIVINKKVAREQLILIAAVKGEDFNFSGSVKRKLDMPKLKRQVKEYVFEELITYFKSDSNMSDQILLKFKFWNR